MARYYEADKLLEYVELFTPTINGETTMQCVKTAIRNAPTADVADVVYAKWEISSDGYYPYCSHCKTEPENGVMSKYCPECGAKMDKKEIEGFSDV